MCRRLPPRCYHPRQGGIPSWHCVCVMSHGAVARYGDFSRTQLSTQSRIMAQTKTKPADDTPVTEMTPEAAAAAHKQLAAEIAEADRLYYQEDAPHLSDAEYDALRRRNEAIEARFPELSRRRQPDRSKSAPPRRTKFAKVRHAVPMLSLGNAFDEEDVARVRRPRAPLPQDRRPTSPSNSPPSRRSTACRISLRYEDGKLVAGRHARRRRGRRERHRQCAHHRRRPASGCKARDSRPSSRCAARST